MGDLVSRLRGSWGRCPALSGLRPKPYSSIKPFGNHSPHILPHPSRLAIGCWRGIMHKCINYIGVMDMFTTVDKALAALLMAVVFLVNTFFNTGLTVDPATVNTIAALVTPVLIWLVPNKRA